MGGGGGEEGGRGGARVSDFFLTKNANLKKKWRGGGRLGEEGVVD